AGWSIERGPARVHRDPLCAHFAGQQQRVGLWRAHRSHYLLPRRRCRGHAHRTLRHHDPGPRTRWIVGHQERRPGLARDLPHRQRHVRRTDDRGDRHHRWPDLLPGHLSRPPRRAAQPRKVLLMTTSPTVTQPETPPATGHGVAQARSLFDREILRQAVLDAVVKFKPSVQVRNPVMFVVLVGSVITLIEAIAHPGKFAWSITIWLFLTVMFANFAEAMAEGRGKAQADTLRKMRSETLA